MGKLTTGHLNSGMAGAALPQAVHEGRNGVGSESNLVKTFEDGGESLPFVSAKVAGGRHVI